PLEQHGLKWIFPDAPLAHPLEEGEPAVLERSVHQTAESLGKDALHYARLIEPFVDRWNDLAADILAPIHIPKRPLLVARFARLAIQSAITLAEGKLTTLRARALFAGIAGHSILPLEQRGTAAFGLLLGIL